MKHPFVRGDEKVTSHLVGIEVEGEFKNNVPHGLCYMKFIYRGEFSKDWNPG